MTYTTHLHPGPISQRLQVLDWLKSGYSLTLFEAIEKFDCVKLADVIYKLRNAGHEIRNVQIEQKGKKITCYYMSINNLT